MDVRPDTTPSPRSKACSAYSDVRVKLLTKNICVPRYFQSRQENELVVVYDEDGIAQTSSFDVITRRHTELAEEKTMKT